MTQAEIQNRLQEIQAISLQNLGDDAVLALLAERKELLKKQEELQKEAEAQKQEEERKRAEEARLAAEAKAKEWEQKKEMLQSRLATLNKSISPDQPSEKLLALIQERKVVEAELEVFAVAEPKPEPTETITAAPAPAPEPVVPLEEKLQEPIEEKKGEPPVPVETVNEPMSPVSEETPKQEEDELSATKISIQPSSSFIGTSHISGAGKVSQIEDSEGRIALDNSLQGSEFEGYLSELKANTNSLGTFLQGLSPEVKRNRAFMLQVANIDPAYAMHYADKDTLKKDETFNVTIAGMNNQRNTGNPLSEMLPEMRTGAVLLAGVRNDFRNVRFIRPEMPEYEEILALAKKGALEAVSSLKEAHDLKVLLPPILQKDKAFMAEVAKLVK